MRNLIRLYYDPAAAPAAGAVAEPPVAAASETSVTAPQSASATVNINEPPAKAEVTPAGGFAIPDTYKDRAYLKGVDSMEKVYAMLDGAQKLIGQKGPALPGKEATQAERDAYYESIGRPKTPGEYKITGSDKADPTFFPRVQAAMHKYGLSQDQAEGLWQDVNAGLSDWIKDKGLKETQQDVDFTKLATDTFGVDRDAVLARGKELISANISPAMKDAVGRLDNNALVVLADVMRNIDKKYIKSDTMPNNKVVLNAGTPDELRGQARLLMEKQSKMDPLSQEYNSLQKQINDIYDNIRRAQR